MKSFASLSESMLGAAQFRSFNEAASLTLRWEPSTLANFLSIEKECLRAFDSSRLVGQQIERKSHIVKWICGFWNDRASHLPPHIVCATSYVIHNRVTRLHRVNTLMLMHRVRSSNSERNPDDEATKNLPDSPVSSRWRIRIHPHETHNFRRQSRSFPVWNGREVLERLIYGKVQENAVSSWTGLVKRALTAC